MSYILFILVCVIAYKITMKAFEKGGDKYYGVSCGFAAVVFVLAMNLMAKLFFV